MRVAAVWGPTVGEAGQGKGGGVCGVGRRGAREEGALRLWSGVGNHSIPGMAACSPLIMQPQGAVWACQSRLERWHGKTSEGACAPRV